MKFLKSLFIVFLVLYVCASSFANSRRPEHPPAQNPDFSLIESDSSHVVIRYARPEGEDPLYRTQENLFVGIPVDATFEIQFSAWSASIYNGRELIHRISSERPTPEGVTFSMETHLPSIISTVRTAYQELDILKIQISPSMDIPSPKANTAYRRDKVVLDELHFTVFWTEEETGKKPEQISTLDAGYNRLYQNMIINATRTQELRRKRSLPEEEKNQGFYPQILGYDFKQEPLNPAIAPLTPRTDRMIVRVRQEGLTAIRPLDFRRQGMDVSTVNLQQVRLWHMGEQIPIYVNDSNGNNLLEDSESIYFYGEETESEYTNDRIYFLTWSEMDTAPLHVPSEPLLWEEQEGSRSYYAYERYTQDKVLGRNQSSLSQYAWFYKALIQKENIFPLELEGLQADGDVTLQLRMRNNSRGNVGFTVVAGNFSQPASMMINQTTDFVFTFPAEDITSGATLAIILNQAPDPSALSEISASAKVGNDQVAFVDHLIVRYPRATDLSEKPVIFHREDVSDASPSFTLSLGREPGIISAWVIENQRLQKRLHPSEAPRRVNFRVPDTSWDKLVVTSDKVVPGPYTMDVDYPSTLHHPSQGYNYVLISHLAFMEEARNLADIRKGSGFNVLLVDVQDIYDEFNAGYPDCNAIKRFLRYTQSEWKGMSPEFVVMIGDSTWDHRDREGYGSRDWVPTYAPVENPQKDGSDEWYAYLWGGENDYFSDVIVGRISIREPEELANYIEKMLMYENETPVGPWKMKNIFIADDTFEHYGRESAQQSLPAEVVSEYIDQVAYPHVTNPYLYHRFANSDEPAAQEYLNKKYCPDCTLAILDAFNEGALIVQYIGHGGNQIWSHERIFYGTDRPYSNVLELKPTNRFPFIMNWSCLTGYLNFNIPPFNVCLAEEFIRYSDKGGIAMWAPSGSGSTDQHMTMTHILSRSLLKDGLTRLGEATTQTKVEYLQIPQNLHPELMNMYIFFGDPAVELALPAEKLNLQVQPNAFLLNQPINYQVQSEVHSFTTGKAIVHVMFDGELFYESKPFNFTEGKLEHAFSITPENIKNSTAAISVYAWNEELNLDAWGGMKIPRYEPILILANGNVSSGSGESRISFDIYNSSAFPAFQVEAQVLLQQQNSTVPVDMIPQQATVTVEWKGSIPEGLDMAYIALKSNPAIGLKKTEPSKRLAIPLREINDVRIVPLLGQKATDAQSLIEGSRIRLTVPMRNQSTVDAATTTVTLNGPGAVQEDKTIILQPGDEQTADFRIDMPSEGIHTYTLITQESGQKKNYPFTLEVLGKPDLALAEGEYQVEPQTPVIGKTVSIRTTVFNVGTAPATDIAIMAYDGDPSLNRRLSTFNNRRRPTIERLEPGEMKEVLIEWDPVALEGQGLHEIHLVVDPYERINELSEENNRIHFPLTLHDLPDLKVDMWNDHKMITEVHKGLAVWGQPLKIWGRVTNVGDSTAEYIRVSFDHNGREYTKFIPSLPPKTLQETQFEIPLVSAKNTLRMYVDRYDLIAEKNEVADNLTGNVTENKIEYYQLVMPEGLRADHAQVYRVQNETEFSAGLGEYTYFDQDRDALAMLPGLDEIVQNLVPVYVRNRDELSYKGSQTQWEWHEINRVFYSPLQTDASLRFELPVPNGNYDVYVQAYSNAWERDATSAIRFKTPVEKDYVTLVHSRQTAQNNMFKLGNYQITDDTFLIDFKPDRSTEQSVINRMKFIRTDSPRANTISTSYLSPYFPAPGTGAGITEMTWDAEVPEGTRLQLKARWVLQDEDGNIRYFPWAGITDGEKQVLRIPGRGNYFQYHVSMSRDIHDGRTPLLRNIQIKIPMRSAE